MKTPICDFVNKYVKQKSHRLHVPGHKGSGFLGIENFDISPILESIEFLLQNKVDYEFRTTVVKELHTKEDVEKIAQLIKGTNNFNLQGFKDSGDLIEEGFSSHDKETLKEMLKVTQNIIKTATLRGI
jgi:pyruvate formate lyase activating enzyme